MQDVFDKDVFQNDFMGTVSLTVDEIKEASKVFYLILKVHLLFKFPTIRFVIYFFIQLFNSLEDYEKITNRILGLPHQF